jgi:putative ABC transport system permease protein
MLLSYLKIAWKVLLRRKFFTAISLFGISFTLMILLVVYALFDYTLGPHQPERQVDRLLFASRMEYKFKTEGISRSSLGYAFLEQHVRGLRTPEKVSISDANWSSAVAYVGNQTLKLDQKHTDSEFWQVLDFDFVAGRPYNLREVRDAAHVAVINETTARRYFGSTQGVVGRTIELEAKPYQVVGVVRDVPLLRFSSYADVWLPITTSTSDLRDPSYMGSCQAILLARSPAEVPLVQQEYAQMIARQPNPDPQKVERLESQALLLRTAVLTRYTGAPQVPGGDTPFLRRLLSFGLLFMLLPALNLVNINVSRTLERSGEIGVRKAFGATAGRLVGQFLIENIFLTLLGGLLGVALALGVLHVLNDSQFFPYSAFGLNSRVLGVALGIALFFGLLSGVYPAYKLSKLPAVQALKGDTAV